MNRPNSNAVTSLSTDELNQREVLIVEARRIVNGETMMLATGAHLCAVLSAYDDLLESLQKQNRVSA